MRLTKGIKKTLSVVLAAAMVIGGTATGGKISNAEEATDSVIMTVCDKDVTLDENNGVSFDVTDSLKNDWSGNFGYVKSSANFAAVDLKVVVNGTYEFAFDDKLAAKTNIDQFVKDKTTNEDTDEETALYKKFGSYSYNVDLPNIWNYADGDVMATSTDKAASIKKVVGDAQKAVLVVGEEEVAIESATLTFTCKFVDKAITPDVFTVCDKDATVGEDNAVSFDVTDSLKNDWSGNFGYVKSSANFAATGITVKVNDTYEFTFGDKLAAKTNIDQFVKDKTTNEDTDEETALYKKFGSYSYNVDLPNIWNYADGDVMATSTDEKASIKKVVSDAQKAVLVVGEEEVAIESATLTFTFLGLGATAGEEEKEEPVKTEDPYADYKEKTNEVKDEGSMEGFQMYPTVGLDNSWTAPAFKQTVVNVIPDADGKATAEVRFKATVDSDDMLIFYINSNLGNWGKISTNFKWAFKSVTVDGEEVEDVEDNQGLYGAIDGDIENGLRYNVRNPYNTYFLADKISTDNENIADLFAGAKFPIKKDSEYVFTFEFTGMTTGGDYIKYTAEEEPSVYNKDGDKIGELVTNPDGSTTIKPVESAKPAETATGSATTGSSASGSSASGSSASGSSASGSSATPAATASAIPAATATPKSVPAAKVTLKVAKTKLVIVPGKSKTVNVTTNGTIKVSTNNKKLAKVKKLSNKKIKISVPKKATKGKTANITVKAGTVKKVIKVTVANNVKKLKANKKKVTVKKGKTAKVVVKVTSQNKKAKTTDKLTVKTSNKKVAKIAKKSINTKKVVVKVKALKKGTSKVTVKVGKKKVVVKVKVK